MDSSSSSERDTVVVHGMLVPEGHPSLSPFCLKLETFLTLTKIPYVRSKEFAKSSKGKVPWISYNGEEVADSQFCIEFVKSKFGVDLNRGLSTEQRAVAHAFRIMMDEFHFWCNAYFRFYELDDPVFVKFFPPAELRQQVLDRYAQLLPAQGIGRHSEAEVLALFTANLQAAQDYLGEKAFMMGDSPTEVDCSVFAFLAVLIFYTPRQFERQMGKNYVQEKLPKLFEYFLRMKQLTYPDYSSC
ncbi:hypothetical protein EGW08_006929 [Elysia chlorotica]|uniref:GST C-terminal domain-containing protein n=1 Tax=Elysia chlorotica TaxID=188477 RepID=A0A3S1HSM3_ELYCH|nr:hypothetical protein EGW08_006929 [Elysia chlorotica]